MESAETSLDPQSAGKIHRDSGSTAVGGFALTAIVATAFFFFSYGEALGSFFYLDDFWELAVARQIEVSGLSDFLEFFQPVYPSFLLYRPLSTVVFFWMMKHAFGHDPFAYHAVVMGFHVLNVSLVYLIAWKIFGSVRSGIATAMVYAAAPGHALAVYWIALFTMTGTASLYLAAIACWLSAGMRYRMTVTFVLFLLGILSAEHAVTLPAVLTGISIVLLGHDWRGVVRQLIPFWLVAGAYAAAKLLYVRYATNPQVSGYEVAFEPARIVEQLGFYAGFANPILYSRDPYPGFPAVVGTILLVATTVGAGMFASGRHVSRNFRVALFGLGLFLVALAPVLVLPQHTQPYYVGIAGSGLAMAMVAIAKAFDRGRDRLALLVCAVVLCFHAFSSRAAMNASVPFRYLHNASEKSAAWIHTIWSRSGGSAEKEFVIPEDAITTRLFRPVFGPVAAQNVFLCDPPLRVRLAPDLTAEVAAAQKIVIAEPAALSRRTWNRSWDWLRLACPRP